MPVKKPRGRPRKTTSDPEKIVALEPKKRGRPRKDAVKVDGEKATPKKRGRPRKEVSAEI